MLILTIVTIICIIILFKMFSKSTFSFKNDNVETTNANYPFCHPINGKAVDFKLPFTVSFDLYINDINKEKPSHLLTMVESDDLDNKDTMSGCQSLKASTQWWEKDNFLTLYIAKNDNTLAIKSYLLQDNFHVKNLPVKQWFNIRIIVHHNRMLVFLNSSLKYEYGIKSEFASSINELYIRLSQYDGLYDGKIKNVNYYPYVEYYKEPLNMYGKSIDFLKEISYLI